MKTVVSTKDVLNLSDSLLNEIDSLNFHGHVNVEGVVVLNDDLNVLPYVSDFLDSEFNSRQISSKTAQLYGKNIGYCLEHLLSLDEFKGFKLDEPLFTVSRATLQAYFVSLSRSNLTSATIRNRDAALKTFFDKYLCVEHKPLRGDNPYKLGLLSGSIKTKIKEGCEINEVKELMLCTDLERERLLIQFIFDTGVRRSEVERVSLADINNANDFRRSSAYGSNEDAHMVEKGYFPLKISGSKGRHRELKERITLISASTLNRISSYHSSPLYKKHLRKYPNSQESPAFFNSRGQPLSTYDVENIVKKVSNKALFRGTIPQNISAHNLRHGYAYEILRSPDFGKEYLDKLINIQKTLGHSYLSTTQLYTKIPIDLLHLITDERGQILTKSQKMEKLSRDTKIKINIRDKK